MNNPEKKPSKILFINIVFLLIVILIILITASQYISREKTIYYWDYANYENRTKTILDYPQGSVKEFFFAVPKETWLSTGEDYSNIPSIPLLPVMLTFGDSRTVFILGMALLYMLPYAFVVGALAVNLIPAKSFAVIVMVITLILIGWPFVDRAIHTNFKRLYPDWELPVADVIWYYVTSFGWIAWILAFIGYVSGIYFRVLVRPYAIFIFF